MRHIQKHKRGDPKKADYVLFYKPNLPLAIVEAKSEYKTVSAGIQQGIDYAQTLNVPFVYSSNGKGFHVCLLYWILINIYF